MTQKQFLIIAVVCNIFFIFVYIHKQNWIIQLSYEQQKKEQLLTDLQQQEKELINKLHERTKHSTIKKIAQKKLNMRKARLKNIQPLNVE